MRMEVRRGDRSRNGTARGWRRSGGGRGRERGRGKRNGVRGKRRSEAESRESGGIRALISVLGPSKGDEKGGANSRDINSVLAPGGLQRRKLRAEGEYYPSPPRDPRYPAVVPPPPPPSFARHTATPCPAASPRSDHPRARGENGEALQIRD